MTREVFVSDASMRFAPPARLSNEELMRRKHRAAELRNLGREAFADKMSPSSQDVADAGAEDPGLISEWVRQGLFPEIGTKPRRGRGAAA